MDRGSVIDLEDGWKSLKEDGIDLLTDMLDSGLDRDTEPFPPKKYSPLYTLCYNMCTQRTPYNWSELLYQRHGEVIERYLSTTVVPALREKHDAYLLQELTFRWNNHKLMNKWMRMFFMYLDRYYVKHHSVPTLHEAGLAKFRTIVFDSLKRDVVAAILNVVQDERDGVIVDKELLRSCIEVFSAMGPDTYQQDLETPLLAATQEYYARKAAEWVTTDDTPSYLRKAADALAREAQRVSDYLESGTEPRLMTVCEQELLARHQADLLGKEGSGCAALLREERVEDLARMYTLFSRIPGGLPPMAAIVREYLTEQGMAVVRAREAAIASGEKDSPSNPAFVQGLLDQLEAARTLVDRHFMGNSLFQKAQKEAFETFCNKDIGKYSNAELMSTFCDRILKSGSGEKLTDAQIEAALDRIVQLFGFLQDKDLFAEIYRNQLAKRLLMGRSASDDAERSMISKLKLRCGAQFTGKMEGMLNDLAIGADLQAEFREHLAGRRSADGSAPLAMDFSVQVLTTGFWPTYKLVDVTLQDQMLAAIGAFRTWYLHKTSHRRLQWVHSLGTATISYRFKRRHDLILTTLQAAAVLAFNTFEPGAWVPFARLREALGVEDGVLKRILHSLSCGRYRVLAKDPPPPKKRATISTDDNFRVNARFTSKMIKIRIPMASLDDSHNPKRVEEDRSIAIEAAVVRIMKARKRLSHVQLVKEVLHQLHFFRPNPKVIKRRIEQLIEREYLERDPDEPGLYSYLA